MRPQLVSVLIGFALTLAFLALVPAPEGCGCASRKRKLQQLGGRLAGA